MKVYVMRHGTTVWNEKGIIQGRSHNRLSAVGKQLTQEVSLKHKNTAFDIIFTSPLMRTIQTANIMNQNQNIKIVRDERLIEINQGIFTGRKKSQLTKQEELRRKTHSPEWDMEPYKFVFERTQNFINDLKTQNFKNVLIVTHNLNASFMEAILTNKQVDFNNQTHTKNFNNAQIKSFNL